MWKSGRAYPSWEPSQPPMGGVTSHRLRGQRLDPRWLNSGTWGGMGRWPPPSCPLLCVLPCPPPAGEQDGNGQCLMVWWPLELDSSAQGRVAGLGRLR